MCSFLICMELIKLLNSTPLVLPIAGHIGSKPLPVCVVLYGMNWSVMGASIKHFTRLDMAHLTQYHHGQQWAYVGTYIQLGHR